VKFAVSQRPNSHPFNFLYETRLYRGNAMLEMLYGRLKKIIRASRFHWSIKNIRFFAELNYCQKLLLASLMLISCHL